MNEALEYIIAMVCGFVVFLGYTLFIGRHVKVKSKSKHILYSVLGIILITAISLILTIMVGWELYIKIIVAVLYGLYAAFLYNIISSKNNRKKFNNDDASVEF